MGLLEKAKKIREATLKSTDEKELEKQELEKWEKEAEESLQLQDTDS